MAGWNGEASSPISASDKIPVLVMMVMRKEKSDFGLAFVTLTYLHALYKALIYRKAFAKSSSPDKQYPGRPHVHVRKLKSQPQR